MLPALSCTRKHPWKENIRADFIYISSRERFPVELALTRSCVCKCVCVCVLNLIQFHIILRAAPLEKHSGFISVNAVAFNPLTWYKMRGCKSTEANRYCTKTVKRARAHTHTQTHTWKGVNHIIITISTRKLQRRKWWTATVSIRHHVRASKGSDISY